MTTPARSEALTNPNARSVRKVAGLSGRALRVKTGLTLVEAPQAVRELVSCAPHALKDLYVTDAAARAYGDIVEGAQACQAWIHPVSEAVSRAMAPAGQGMVAVARTEPMRTSLDDVLAATGPVVVLPRTQDPGNAGTIIRLADATGAAAVIGCTGTVDLTSPKVIRASAGSVFHVPVVEGGDFANVTARLRDAGVYLVGAHGYAERSLEEVLSAAPLRLGWVFGNEARGLSDAEIASLDAVAALEMWGRAESYNVASAAAICLYMSARARKVVS